MAKFNEKQVGEINLVIETITKAMEKNSNKKFEIGSRDKAILLALLKSTKTETERLFFPCKREYSDTIVSHFVSEKGLAKNKFSANAQQHIYLLF